MKCIKNKIMIPGGVIAMLTFPGVMMHELSHYLMCKLFGVHVSELKLFSIESEHFSLESEAPIGWVSHAIPDKYYQTVLISTAPIIFNTIIAIVTYHFALTLFRIGLFHYVFLYLGFCCAVNAFPSKGDGEVLWHTANMEISVYRNYFAYLTYPLILVIITLHYLSYVWANFIYGYLLFIFTRIYI